MRIETFIEKLEQEQASFARKHMASIRGDMFAMGRDIGIYAGLEHAKRLLHDILEAEAAASVEID